MKKVWMTRGGREGEYQDFALSEGTTGGGWTNVPDLTGTTDHISIKALVAQTNPEATPGAIRNWAGQLYSLVATMSVGDYVIMPLKGQGIVAVGEVTSEYIFDSHRPPGFQHFRRVNWVNSEVPKTSLAQDVQRSLGTFMTICEIKRDRIEERISTVLLSGIDPFLIIGEETEPADVLEEENVANAAQISIQELIRSRFPGHDLAVLVEAVLQANGYKTRLSPPGPDEGADVLAASGDLGFDGPRVAVQVKNTGNPVGVSTINELLGAKDAFHADRALFVSWAGYSSPAMGMAKTKWFDLRLWTADDLVDQVTAVYDRLPEAIRVKLPLRQVWTSAIEPASS